MIPTANLINQNLYEKIGTPVLTDSTVHFFGFGGSKVTPIGCFEDVIAIDNECFQVKIYVVKDEAMIMEGVIGNELLSQAEVNITQNGIIISKAHEVLNGIISPNYTVTSNTPSIGNGVCKEKRKEVENLLDSYEPRKIKTSDIEMTITMNEDQKVSARPRRLPFPERKIVTEQVDQWIKEGIVEPCSSEYSSPVVVTKKKDGTPQICIDYRAINRLIMKDRYPLPLIKDILDRLQDARVYSASDLRNGFFHVPVNKNS